MSAKLSAFAATLLLVLPVVSAASEELLLSRAPAGTQTLAPLVKRVIHSVVSITATADTLNVYPVPEHGSGFPDGPLPVTRVIHGSGVIVDVGRGLLVTSDHIVKGADTISVKLFDGRRLDGRIALEDKKTDLAILQIDAPELTASPIGKTGGVEPGDFVLAIGDPLGLDHSASFGMISALHRSWPGISSHDLIQTDVLLDRGSSGGPLFNLNGEVIGINIARVGDVVNERSFGFAVPASAVAAVLSEARKPDY